MWIRFGVAAVEGRVAPDEAGDPHGLRALGRELRLGGHDDDLRRAVDRPKRRGEKGLLGGLDVELAAVARRDQVRLPRVVDAEVDLARGARDRAAQVVEVLLGIRAADPELALAVVRQLQERGDLLGGDREVHALVGEDHRTGERDAYLLRDRGERVLSHGRRRGLDRQGDRPFALEGGEGGHDRLPGRGSVEAAAGLPGNHDRLSVAQNDRRLAPVHVHLLRDHAELALEGGLVGARGRVDVGAEQPKLEALEPPERHRAVPAVDGRHRGGAPVAADGELRRGDRPAAAGPREDDRLRGERMGACVELGLSLGCGEAADVLARDRDAVGDHVRRPGVGEAHDEHCEEEDSDERRRSSSTCAGPRRRRSRRARDLRPLRTEPTPASALIEGFDSSNRRRAARR